jgi:hypothetical protein
MDISCYPDATIPPNTPVTCNLEGHVVLFANVQPIQYNQYIEVRVHALSNVLSGVNANPIASTTVVEDVGHNMYSLSGLPTNAELVMEVRCSENAGPDCTLHPMYTFVVYLRADDCQSAGGTIDFSAPAIEEPLWSAYNTAGGKTQAYPNMGLVFGRLRDCAPDAMIKGTGDMTMPYFQFGDHRAVLYIPFGGPPQESDASTLSPGLFGAANALPVRGLAAALIRDGANPVSLRTYPFRVFPGAASLVLFGPPKIPQ